MNSADVQDVHDGVVLIKYEARPPAPGSWEETSATMSRGTPQRRSARLSGGFAATLDSRTSGQLRNTLSRAREICERWRGGGAAIGAASPPAASPPPSACASPAAGGERAAASPAAPPAADAADDSPGGRLSRWFSVRRGSHHHYDMADGGSGNANQDKMPGLPELDEEFSVCRRMSPPALPPPPPDLTTQQLRRRHIVAAIIHSENSYVATLQRLVNDYKKPLEQSSPVILSGNKVATLFHRLPEILQCHTQFRTALTDCARTWDKDEKIGDVFLTAFSKAVVLDVYSDFINNFSVAMELAKMESKRKSALADFFKVKQISAHDRLSFFGLMVKPVQRFPQFIMFLQDLLKHTPPGHVDRMALQRALTRLEALADALNESKRDAERTQAFRATLRRLGGRGGLSAAGGAGAAGARLLAARAERGCLLRQDDAALLEFAADGALLRVKQRRLLLLDDLVVCASVQRRPPGAADERPCGAPPDERLSLKWAHPLADVKVLDSEASPTLSRILAAGLNRGGSLRSNGSSGRDSNSSAGDSLCAEMSMLMHDYEVVSRMADLATGLKTGYPEFSSEVFKKVLQHIQQSIQRKDEEMSASDGRLLRVCVRGREVAFRAESAAARDAWAAALRGARLAAAPANSPAWRPAPHPAPRHQRPKAPLFVAARSVAASGHLTEVRCGCFYRSSGRERAGGRWRRPRGLLWLAAGDGASSRVAVLGQPPAPHRAPADLRPLTAFDLLETQVSSMEYVKGSKQSSSPNVDTVWLGTDSGKIIIFSASEPEKQEKVAETAVPSSVLHIKYHCDCVFAALNNGTLAVYRRGSDGAWSLRDPVSVVLGKEPVLCLLPVNGIIYASSGLRVFVLNGSTAEILRTSDISSESGNRIGHMAHSGVGLWIALKNSTAVRLYHSETFEHLQDIDVAADVAKTIGAREGAKPAHVSALLAGQGLLWVGTTAGVSLTVPLPRLEGLPAISGHADASYHAHAGAVSFLLSLEADGRDADAGAARRSVAHARAAKEAGDGARADEAEKAREPERRPSGDADATPARTAASPGRIGASRRRGRGVAPDARLSKTLPRGAGGGGGGAGGGAPDVYGLYGDLMFVKDCAAETEGGGAGETLRRSDPELATIPARVDTLDRRLRMRAGRPRSLDLSNWSVDSRTSSLCASSGSEESMALRGVSRNSSGAGAAPAAGFDAVSSDSSAAEGAADASVSRGDSLAGDLAVEERPAKSAARSAEANDFAESAPRAAMTIMGGRGYVDWRQVADASERPVPSADPNPKDAHIILWEMRP